MKIVMMAAAAALLAAPAMAQEPPVLSDALVLPGATPAPDCGNLYGLAGRAFCVSAPLAGLDTLAEAYVANLGSKGWIAADGAENRVVFVRRREGGGCDGLQMFAFHDASRPVGPESIGYLGFGPIPGNVCSDQRAPAAAPAPAQ